MSRAQAPGRGGRAEVSGAGAWLAASLLGLGLALAAGPAMAIGQCGNQEDTCKCGKNNPYPCCDNGSNCTWWAWHEACCNWGIALPGWGNANTWHSYAKQNANFSVLSQPEVGSIATSTKGQYGHVAWVTSVGNGTVTVREMNCCGTCSYGMITRTHPTSYFNSGFIVPKQKGPVCGQAGCEGGENCSNCPQDCGSCCGNGKCDNGEHCASCSKDCGACCGNGACDHGETCGTCSKDCACPPKGALELAACGATRGWASDDNDGGKALTVRLRADGKEFDKVSAALEHPSHGKHAFTAATPAALLDDVHHEVSAVAEDSDGKGDATVGKLPLRCRQGARADGPWRTLASPISGVDAQVRGAGSAVDGVAASVSRLCGLDHRRDGADPYALSGQLESCLRPGTQPFDGALVDLVGGTADLPLSVELRVDDALSRVVGAKEPGQTVMIDRSGHQLCVQSKVKSEVQGAPSVEIAVRSVRFHTAGWWHGVEAKGHGLRLQLRSAEGANLVAEPPEGLPGVVGASGAVRLWRVLEEPFDLVRGKVEGVDVRAEAALLPHAEADEGPALTGHFELSRLTPRSTLCLRLGRPPGPDGGGALVAGPLLAIQELRLARHGEWQVGAFDVKAIASFGLRALTVAAATANGLEGLGSGIDKASAGGGVPGSPSAAQQLPAFGRSLVLVASDPGWWTTGTLRAALHDGDGRYERARLSLRIAGATGGLGLRAVGLLHDEVDATGGSGQQTVQAVPLPTLGQHTVELALAGDRLGIELSWLEGQWQAPLASVRLEGVALRRAGWWSLPSADASGLFDARGEGGSVKLVAQQGPAAVVGARMVLRELQAPHRALRFRLRQHLPVAALRLAILLDGVPAAVLEEPGPSERQVLVLPAASGGNPVLFKDIGILLQRKSAPMPSGEFFAEASQIEVQGQDGKWRSLAQAKLREAPALQPVAMPAAVTAGQSDADAISNATDAVPTASSARSGGCSASARSGRASADPPQVLALALLGIGLGLARLRAGRGSLPGAARGR